MPKARCVASQGFVRTRFQTTVNDLYDRNSKPQVLQLHIPSIFSAEGVLPRLLPREAVEQRRQSQFGNLLAFEAVICGVKCSGLWEHWTAL